MRRSTLAVVCALCVIIGAYEARGAALKPIRVSAGSVLSFYLQTRLNPDNGSVIDQLPKGTVLNIKVMDSIDSEVTRDGAEFRGLVVTPLVSGDEVIIHADAQVRGLFAILRSRSHPEGFRYELLITGITDGGKTFQLTASMNPSFIDAPSRNQNTSASSSGSDSSSAEKSTPPSASDE
jgi:hypothetical protein